LILEEIKENLVKLASNLTEGSSILDSDLLNEGGTTLSSLAYVRLVLEIETFFNIEFEDDKLLQDSFSNIDQLAEYILLRSSYTDKEHLI
jgi:acyl carrier protein